MKRLLALLAATAFTMGYGANASAQTRGFAAGAFIVDDLQAVNHKVVLKAPVFGSAAWNAWQAAPYNGQTLSFSVPIPPTDNAQAGFMLAGPMATPPPGTKPRVPFWVYPQEANTTNGSPVNGGPMGTWSFATTDQLGILTTSGSGTQNYVTKWTDGTGTQLGNSAIAEDATTFTINTTAGGSTAKFSVALATGNTTVSGTLDARGTIFNGTPATALVISDNDGVNINTLASTGNTGLGNTTGNVTLNAAATITEASGSHVFANVATGGVSAFAIPNNASFIEVADNGAGTSVSLTTPTTPVTGKILYVHNADAQATAGFAVIPAGATWSFIYNGTAWQLLQ